jgi:hypothetical protein
MSRKCVCVALVAIFALAASRFAQAQVTVDVTKVNCDQFVHHKISPGSSLRGSAVTIMPNATTE